MARKIVLSLTLKIAAASAVVKTSGTGAGRRRLGFAMDLLHLLNPVCGIGSGGGALFRLAAEQILTRHANERELAKSQSVYTCQDNA